MTNAAEVQRRMDRRRSRLGALGATLTKTDRIITGRSNVTVSIKEESITKHIPAHNNGKDITINSLAISNIESASGLVTCLGLNHHEVAHVLYSPSYRVPWVSDVRARGEWDAYNLLEDMRIEALFSARYSSAKKYLTMPVMEFIIKDEDAWPTAHMLTYGRRYLPLEIRKEMRKRFIATTGVRKAIEQCIDKYRALDVCNTNNYMRAASLVSEMHNLMAKVLPQLSQQEKQALSEHHACGGHEVFDNTITEVRAAAQEASQRREEEDAAQDEKESRGEDGSGFYDDETEDDSENESHGGSEDGGSDSEDDDDSDETDVHNGGGGDDEDGDDENVSGNGDPIQGDDDGAGAPGSQGGGDGSPQSGDDESNDGDSEPVGGDSSDSIENMMNRAVNQVEHDSSVQDEVTRLRNAMTDNSLVDVDFTDVRSEEVPPSPKAASASGAVIREFQQLRSKFEAGWEYGTDSGRVNVQRAMTADFGDMDFFDNWDEGREDDAGLEAVVLLDNSVSMGQEDMWSASEAAWVIKRGLDEVDAVSTVVTFSMQTNNLYRRGERANPSAVRHVKEMQGATRPGLGMQEARRLLSVSERPNKLFVVVTDGGFSDHRGYFSTGDGSGNSYKDLLEAIPASRVFVGIRQNPQPDTASAYDVVANVNEPQQIVDIVRSAVRSMLDEALKRR